MDKYILGNVTSFNPLYEEVVAKPNISLSEVHKLLSLRKQYNNTTTKLRLPMGFDELIVTYNIICGEYITSITVDNMDESLEHEIGWVEKIDKYEPEVTRLYVDEQHKVAYLNGYFINYVEDHNDIYREDGILSFKPTKTHKHIPITMEISEGVTINTSEFSIIEMIDKNINPIPFNVSSI
jgi:hypothetical protein